MIIRIFLFISLSIFTTSLQSQNINDWMFNYQFDGNAKDYGPKKNDGIIKGSVSPVENRFGEKNKAMYFDGNKSGYISIPYNSSLNLPVDKFTFSIWIKLSQYHKTNYWDVLKTDSYAPIFTKAEFEQSYQYRLGFTPTGYHFDGVSNNYLYGTFYTAGPVIKTGMWHFIALTFDNYILSLYVDGKLVNSEARSNIFAADTHPLVLGRDLPGALEYYYGAMDDFKVWFRSLNSDEINKLYESEKAATLNSTETTAAGAFEVAEGETIILHNVLFVQSKSELLSASYEELEKLLETFKKNPGMEIEISGHTDNQGDRKKNILLSEERAKAVKDFLVEKGISKSRIKCKGYGPDKPLNSNKTEEERMLNRRVEFKIIKK